MLGRCSGRRELAPDLESAWGRVLGPGVFADTGGPMSSVVVRVGAVPVLCQLQSYCGDPAADAKGRCSSLACSLCRQHCSQRWGWGCSAQAHEAGQHSPRALQNGAWRRKSHSGHPHPQGAALAQAQSAGSGCASRGGPASWSCCAGPSLLRAVFEALECRTRVFFCSGFIRDPASHTPFFVPKTLCPPQRRLETEAALRIKSKARNHAYGGVFCSPPRAL